MSLPEIVIQRTGFAKSKPDEGWEGMTRVWQAISKYDAVNRSLIHGYASRWHGSLAFRGISPLPSNSKSAALNLGTVGVDICLLNSGR